VYSYGNCVQISHGTADDGEDAWEKRRDLCLSVIRKHSPDVIGLQEALRFQIDEIRAAMPVYGEVGVGRDDGKTTGEYSAILYRTDRFTIASSGTFWFSETPEVIASKTWGNEITRICTWARLIEPDTRAAFTMFNLHLDHRSEPSRRKSAELLAHRILARPDSREPVVVTGDFNCGEKSPAIQFLLGQNAAAVEGSKGVAEWTGMRDTFRIVHPHAASVGTFHAFKGETSGEKIDYIFVQPRTEVIDATIDRTSRDGRYPSDHYAVTARVRLR
jgi:endonuclease/exonuclease/phosphatase family metal-dependent hydrolase